MERWAFSDRNPWLWPLPYLASGAHNARQPRSEDNVPVRLEHLQSEAMRAALDLYRDLRDALYEAAFFQTYGHMFSLQMADERAELRKQTRLDPREMPAVRQVLDTLEQGGRREGLARIAMLLGRAGGGKHRLSQMARVREILSTEVTDPMSEDERRRLLQEETIVVEFEPERAMRSLSKLLRTAADRRIARSLLNNIEAHFTLDDRQRRLIAEFRELLPAIAQRRGEPTREVPATRGRKARRSPNAAAAA
jgi:Protein of unknown function (DUF3141)